MKPDLLKHGTTSTYTPYTHEHCPPIFTPLDFADTRVVSCRGNYVLIWFRRTRLGQADRRVYLIADGVPSEGKTACTKTRAGAGGLPIPWGPFPRSARVGAIGGTCSAAWAVIHDGTASSTAGTVKGPRKTDGFLGQLPGTSGGWGGRRATTGRRQEVVGLRRG